MQFFVMLYIMLAYLMLFAALSNAVCLYNASFLLLIFANVYSFIFCLVLLTHSYLVKSCTILQYAQYATNHISVT